MNDEEKTFVAVLMWGIGGLLILCLFTWTVIQ